VSLSFLNSDVSFVSHEEDFNSESEVNSLVVSSDVGIVSSFPFSVEFSHSSGDDFASLVEDSDSPEVSFGN